MHGFYFAINAYFFSVVGQLIIIIYDLLFTVETVKPPVATYCICRPHNNFIEKFILKRNYVVKYSQLYIKAYYWNHIMTHLITMTGLKFEAFFWPLP